MPIQGIIFDMDGVLCDSESFICEAACRMFREVHGTTVQPEDFIPFVGAGEDRYLGGVAEQHGLRLVMPRDKSTTYALYLELIKGRLQPLPGVHEFIQQCRAHGLKCAVATSADRIKMEGNLKEIDLPADWFEACITGDDVQHKKPDPEIFLKAAAALNLPPDRCLVVEDAVNGIQAARAAGCTAWGITGSFNSETLESAGAARTAPNLTGGNLTDLLA